MKRRWFFDLDHTLINTNARTAQVDARLLALGSSIEDIRRTREALMGRGQSFLRQFELLGYPPEIVAQEQAFLRELAARGDEFLFPGVSDTLRQLAAIDECNLLTFGDPEFQREKFHGLTSIRELITTRHYVWHNQTKGEVIRSYGSRRPTLFVDDAPRQLEDVARHAPETTLYRIMWPELNRPSHPLDGVRWRVIHSLTELVQ